MEATKHPDQPAPDLIPTGEAARLLAVHPATVRRMIDAGQLRAIRVGSGHHRVSRAAVLAILEPLTAGGEA